MGFSVILAVLNEGPTIEDTLHDVRGFFPDAEVVVVDDSDDDNATADAVADARDALGDDADISYYHRPPGQRSGGRKGAQLTGFIMAKNRTAMIMEVDPQHGDMGG